ncbi:MAG: DNA polymerase III subunit alpha [Candidatus Gracilibacteria bacterium]
MFVHLHNHSYYSLLEGLSSPAKLAARVKELGQPGCAITDHGVMYGAVEFYKACKEQDITPIIGCEVYVAATNRFDNSPSTGTKRHNLVLIAENHTGYKNLLQLTTKAFTEGFYYKPRVDFEILKEHSEGLICLSSDIRGEISQSILMGKNEEELKALIEKYQEIFGKENYFLEVMDHPDIEDQDKVNKRIIELAKTYDVPLVVTNNSHYAKPEDMEAHEIILCLQSGKDYDDPSRFSMRNGNYSLRSEEELRAIFPDIPEAFDNTVKIMERCHYDFQFGVNLIPSFKVPEGEGSEELFFRKLCWIGTIERYELPFSEADLPILVNKADSGGLGKKLGDTSPEELHEFTEKSYSEEKRKLLENLNEKQKEIVDRLEYEMCVINEMGFCTYFLIVSDFIMWAKDNGIAVGPGRGSAAGAIVAYVLKITDLDPLPHSLLFERFLNPARVSMPDIDTDFEDVRRLEVLDYVTEKYGKQNVAQICTFGSLKAKQAIKDTGRSLGIPYGEMDNLVKKITEKLGTKLKDIIAFNPEIKEAMQNPTYKRVFDLAVNVEGVVRQLGVHACAVVISEKPLTEYTALQFPPKDKKYLVTGYNAKPLEMLGLLKMDFLGLRNLTILQQAIKVIERTKGVTIDLGKLPLDDKKTYELFARGDTKGVFQFESEGMRKWLRELKSTCFEDIIAMVSMYRPGPMAWIPVYIGKKHNLKIQFPSPEAEENFKKLELVLDKYPDVRKILENTNLIPIYQEQILQLAQKFSGFSLGGADLLRRAIGKKIAEELLAQKEKFIEGAKAIGNSPEDAKFIFEKGIEPFADYGFNKSHAACYALIAYQTGYLKAHYPTEFMTALLSTVEDNTEKLLIQIEDCSAMNIEILQPDVNESLVHFTAVKDGQIRFGLNAIKGFGLESAREIVRCREKAGAFTSVEDFIKRAPKSIITRKSLEALILGGALDSLGEDRKVLFSNLETLIEYSKEHHDKEARGQTDIFAAFGGDSSQNGLQLQQCEKSVILERLHWERQYLGFYVTGHPLQGLNQYIAKNAKLIETFTEKDANKKFVIVGFISKVKKLMTKNKEFMAYVTIEGTSSSIAAIAFPKAYTQNNLHIQEEKFVKVSGKFDIRDGEAQFIISEIRGVNIELMIENAKRDNLFNQNEKRSLGVSQLRFGVNAPEEAENTAEDSDIAEQMVQQATGGKKLAEHIKISTEAQEVHISLEVPDVEILSTLKNSLGNMQGKNYCVILNIQGQRIKTPFFVDSQLQLEEALST